MGTGDNNVPLLRMQDICKSFYGLRVLDKVSLDLHSGEVLALLGENGAGKSTLIKILNGDYQRDSGDVWIHGELVQFEQPRDAEAAGIRMIYQELHYAADLSVAENMLIGHLPKRAGLFVDWKRAYEMTSDYLNRLNVKIDPRTRMGDLTVVQREIVEIVKATSQQARILVMDEPTAALTPPEVKHLFGIVDSLREKGVGIIYISHRLDEIFDVAQRVTVLRDGQHVGTHPVASVTQDDLVEMMVGRTIEDRVEARRQAATAHTGEVALRVTHLTKLGAFHDINLEVRAGEIVGVFGLLGAGQADLTRCIFGADTADSGTVTVMGQTAKIQSPQDGKRAGIGFVPIDRKVNGLVLGMSVRKNITLSNWRNLESLGVFRQKQEKQHTQRWIDDLGIRMAGGMEVETRFLSGGNQQKVVLARWLEANVKVLVLNEPTWGVDVGARSDIYDQLELLAEQGLAILMVSSDIQEVLSVSHRILTIHEGRITGEFMQMEATEESLLEAAAGGLDGNQPIESTR
ncbi:MAG: sugar ABC transporter ATP-binding protein [Phototrophicaceae bacterium]